MNNKIEKINFKPIYGWNGYDSKIHFVYRDETGKKKIHTIEKYLWYFCMNKKDLLNQNISNVIEKAKSRKTILDIKEINGFLKIYCNGDKWSNGVKWMIKNLKDLGADLREIDLSLTKRYMIDNMIEIEEDLKYLFFDIETDDSKGGIEIGRDQILSWAACDHTGKTYFEKIDNIGDFESESKIIKNLVKLFVEHDLVISWNGSQFDMPYIENRIEKLDIKTKGGVLLNESPVWKRFIHLDMMKRFIKLFGPSMTMLGLNGFSLNEVSRVFVKDEKVHRTEKIIDLFKNNQEKLEEYNIKDAKLMYDMNERMGTLPLMIKECVWTGTFMDRFYIGELLDNYILREANKKNFFLKPRPEWGDTSNDELLQIRGGFVMVPKTGLFDHVRTFDFKSMYPSIIVGWNIGQESLVEGELSIQAEKNFKEWLGDRKIEEVDFTEWYNFLKSEDEKFNSKHEYIQTANNQFFRKDKPSIIAGLIKRLLNERKTYKKIQLESTYNSIEYKNAQASQEAIKEMCNSMYGITADKQSRFFDPRIAEAITVTGQFVNRTTMSILKKMGYDVIYGDTDSIFTMINEDSETEKVTKELNEKLSNHLTKRYHFVESIIVIEYEKHFRKFAMVDKKRYSGHLIEIDNKKVDTIYTKGMENVRKNTIEFSRKKINECFDLLLKKDKDEKHMTKWLLSIKEEILNSVIQPEELSITMKISKPISSYKSKPPHVRLAEKLIKENKILETQEGKHVWGEKIEYIVVDSKNKNESVLLTDFDGHWDRKYYWDVQTYAPIMRIFQTIWPETNWKEHEFAYIEKIEKKKIQEEKKKENEKLKEQKKIERENKKKNKKLKKEDIVFEQTSSLF
jgi:DNA polymerase elongation subunit (family B)